MLRADARLALARYNFKPEDLKSLLVKLLQVFQLFAQLGLPQAGFQVALLTVAAFAQGDNRQKRRDEE